MMEGEEISQVIQGEGAIEHMDLVSAERPEELVQRTHLHMTRFLSNVKEPKHMITSLS